MAGRVLFTYEESNQLAIVFKSNRLTQQPMGNIFRDPTSRFNHMNPFVRLSWDSFHSLFMKRT
ncbi:hypothetical protein THOG11_70247 [Vibrio harveyi]|nr:hypothetical protein TH15OA1_470012 [Vibrio harveyi]CAH1587606.1 hypothetical protein THOG11_70247 [Vibrio harveyi]